VTDTGGLDVLIAWATFIALLFVLAAFLLRGHPDPIDEARRRTDSTTIDEEDITAVTRDAMSSPEEPTA
jgi:hypothetical protein